MRERQYSNPRRAQTAQSKLTIFNGVVAAFAAIAGVAFTAWQTFKPDGAPQQQIAYVTVAAPAPTGGETVAAKADAAASYARPARFSAALNDGSEKKYVFAALFDGDPGTSISVDPADRELNVLASFEAVQTVTGLDYTPPTTGAGATTVDIMVLPEGRIEASGRAVYSFALQTTPGSQTLNLPASERGKAIWIRVAGPEGNTVQVGEFKVLTRN